MTTQLYRHFDSEGTLLYVGISLSALYRLAQHRQRAPWFRRIARVGITHFATRDSAILAERIAIETERPLFNRWRPPGSQLPEEEAQLAGGERMLKWFQEQVGNVATVQHESPEP